MTDSDFFDGLTSYETEALVDEVMKRFDAAVFMGSNVTTARGDSSFAYQHRGLHPFCVGLVELAKIKLSQTDGEDVPPYD
jgi:hypothetical protein